jgi:hypothetical protein
VPHFAANPPATQSVSVNDAGSTESVFPHDEIGTKKEMRTKADSPVTRSGKRLLERPVWPFRLSCREDPLTLRVMTQV